MIGKWIKELGIISKHDRIIKLEKEKIIELYSNDTISAVDIALKPEPIGFCNAPW